MFKRFVFSCVSLSLCQGFGCADEQEREVAQHLLEEFGKILIIHEDREEKAEEPANVAEEEVVDEILEKKKLRSPRPPRDKKKKAKAHFAGSKKPAIEEEKKTTKIRNEWVVSKTYPKDRKKKVEEEPSSELEPPARPFLIGNSDAPSKKTLKELSERIDELQSQVNFLEDEVGMKRHRAEMKAPKGLIYFSAEWLFWTTKEEGTEFGITTNIQKAGILSGAESQSVHFGWDSGVRAGMGVHLPEDNWDVFVSYTYFRPTQTTTLTGNITSLALYQGATSDFEIVNSANSDFTINFQLGDVVIGKACPLTERLLLRPFIGMRGAWIKQKNILGFGTPPASYVINRQNFFKGVGGLFGCESNWQLGSGVSFLANIAGALLAGRFDLYQTQLTPTNLYAVNWQDHWKSLSPMVQYTTGLAWDRNFHRDQQHIGIALSFEGQYWWDQNQFPIFMDDILASYTHAQGNLAFYGFNLSVRFDF